MILRYIESLAHARGQPVCIVKLDGSKRIGFWDGVLADQAVITPVANSTTIEGALTIPPAEIREILLGVSETLIGPAVEFRDVNRGEPIFVTTKDGNKTLGFFVGVVDGGILLHQSSAHSGRGSILLPHGRVEVRRARFVIVG